MAGALTLLIFCVIAAFYGGSENKEHKKRSMGIAIAASVVGGIAVLIAFPGILSIGTNPIDWWWPAIVGLIGIIICLVAKNGNSLTGLILFLGVTLVAWALFRWLPAGPAAFQHLGEHVGVAGKELWTGVSGWWDILTGSGPLSGK